MLITGRMECSRDMTPTGWKCGIEMWTTPAHQATPRVVKVVDARGETLMHRYIKVQTTRSNCDQELEQLTSSLSESILMLLVELRPPHSEDLLLGIRIHVL
ncbi:PREDICTED: uncharacterized protein LOC106818594 [Priapulus caudatus]|uniref:Uncharacterized protein LOC106818594 n=1 Tax=Priapulus caudatus TaxID=37621 RepID=A0ABM1F2V2_PRICU|nr:PREDICTED: uncharacterized protein LOC106818594 [Priapulus caudatus]